MPSGRPAPQDALSLLFARSPQPMWIWSRATRRILAVNDAAIRLYGYSRSRFLRLTLPELLTAEERRKHARIIGRMPPSLTHVGVVRHVTSAGRLIEVDVTTTPVEHGGERAQLSLLRDVTAERRLERELSESRRTIKSIVEAAPDYIYHLDRAGRITFINKTVSGLQLPDVEGRLIYRFLEPPTRVLWERKLAEVFATGKAVTFESRGVIARGQIAWFENRLGPLVRDGRVEGVVAVTTDITPRKTLEAKLSAAERYWRDLLSQSPDFIIVLDRRFRISYINRLAEGFEMEKVVGTSGFAYMTPESQRDARRVYARVLRTGQPQTFEVRALGDRGRLTWYETQVSALRKEGRIDGLVSVSRDITEEKTLRGRFEGVFRSCRDSINYLALDGTLLEVNPAYEKLTGFSRKELLGRKRVFEVTPHEYHDLDKKAMAELLRTGRPVELEKEYLRRDGTRVPVNLTCFPVRGPSGRIEGFAAIIKDISERRRLEREILETGAREQSKLGRDLHDSLGQTITGISLLAKGLRSRLARRSTPEAQEALRLSELASHAVRQVRGLARGLLPAELQAAGLGEALDELAANAEDLFGIRCRLTRPRDVKIRDEATAVQLYRIAQEALHNAAKHARSGKDVTLRLEWTVTGLRLVIADRGVGIGGERQGAGLGLGIMEHRAKTLGASLVVRRRRGGGTEVVCDCPLPSALHRKR